MGNRYEGFDAFVATRGAALMRTASLLTGDWVAAEKALQGALTQTAIRWPKVVRGGAPEPEVRRVLYGVVVDHWRRRRLLDVEPSEESDHPVDVAGASSVPSPLTLTQALARLTPRRRAMLVLRYYDDLAEFVIAETLHCSVGTVVSETHFALAQLRTLAPDLAESQFRELMDAAAVSSVSYGMARLAVAGARGQRRQRFTALGAVAAVVAVVMMFVAVAQPFAPASDEVGPRGATGFPGALPSSADLPPLAYAPMDAASAAYIVGGEVVLVNAATGEAVRAFLSRDDIPPSLSGSPAFRSLIGSASWENVALSPNGRMLLLLATTNPLFRAGSRIGYLMDVSSGAVQRQHNVVAVPGLVSGSWFGEQVIAWSPDSRRLACSCQTGPRRVGREPRLIITALPETGRPRLAFRLPATNPGTPIRVAYGGAGPAYQIRPDGAWFLHRKSGDDVTLGVGTALGMGAARDPVLLAGPSDYEIRSVAGVALGGGSLQGQQVVAVGATRAGFVMTLGSPGPAGAPLPRPLGVVLVGEDGQLTTLTELPAGSSSPSFAANLIGP